MKTRLTLLKNLVTAVMVVALQPTAHAQPQDASNTEWLYNNTSDMMDLGMPYTVHWVGNTFPGKATGNPPRDDLDLVHVPYCTNGIYIDPSDTSKTIFTNGDWTERLYGIIAIDGNNGSILRRYGSGTRGSSAITASGNYVFGWRRADVDEDSTKPAKMVKYDRDTGDEVLVREDSGVQNRMSAIVYHNGYLFCSLPEQNNVMVLDAETLATVQQTSPPPGGPTSGFQADRPAGMAVQKVNSGGTSYKTLFLIESITSGSTTTYYIRQRSMSQSGALKTQFTLGANVRPRGICVNAAGTRLYVCDSGVAQRVLTFNLANTISGGNITTVITEKANENVGIDKGVFSTANSVKKGAVGPLRLYFPSAVGIDNSGGMVVVNNGSAQEYKEDPKPNNSLGGNMIQRYTGTATSKTLAWELLGVEFISCGDFSDDGNTFYTSTGVHEFDRNLPPGLGAQKSWKGLRGKIIDQSLDYFHTSISECSVNIATIGSQQLMFSQQNSGASLVVSRITSAAYTVTPVTYFSDGAASYYNSSNGDVWVARKGSGIRYYKMSVVGSTGSPVWNSAINFALPAPFAATGSSPAGRVHRVIRKNDGKTYISGFRGSDGYTDEWKSPGRVMKRYSNFPTTTGSPVPAPDSGFELILPYNNNEDAPKERASAQGVSVMGDYIFVGIGSTSKKPDEFNRPHVFVYRRSNGTCIGRMSPGGGTDEAVGDRPMLDMAGAVNAVELADGSYLVVCQDDGYIKNVIYHWTPNPAL
jgi:hypothetical protein